MPLGAATGFVYAGEMSRLFGWRYAFRLSPVVSFALSSLLLLTVAEPSRGVSDGTVAQSPSRAGAAAAGESSWDADIREILSARSYVYSTLGAVGMTFTSGALAQWAPAFLQRVNCVSTDGDCAASVTRTFGLITMATGIIGTLSGAQLARWYSLRNDAADAIVCAVGLLFATPCVYTAIYLAPRFPGYPTWSAIFLGEVLVSMVWAPNSAILLSVVVPERRSTANSIFLLTTHLFGDSMSPILIGAVADWLHESSTPSMSKGTSLQHALYLSVISTIVASVLFFAAGAHLALDRAKAEAVSYRRVSDPETEGDVGYSLQRAEEPSGLTRGLLPSGEDERVEPMSPSNFIVEHVSALSNTGPGLSQSPRACIP